MAGCLMVMSLFGSNCGNPVTRFLDDLARHGAPSHGPFKVMVNVSGIGTPATSLSLLLNGANQVDISADGTYIFPASLNQGATYFVTIATQPTGSGVLCAVSGGSGTVGVTPVSGILVNCSAGLYAIQVNVSGLAGTGLVMRNNGGDDLAIGADGTFAFSTPLAAAVGYNVTVGAQPGSLSQTCMTDVGASGSMPAASVTVNVTCSLNSFSVSAVVSGLSGTGLVLQNNGGDDLAIASDGTNVFATPVFSGVGYNVTVLSQPTSPEQTCSVSSGTGTIGNGNVTGIAVNCTTNLYNVSITVSGLSGTGLVLRNNGADDLAVSGDGSASFATGLASGTGYAVTVGVQPSSPSQTCTVSSGSGTMPAGNVTNVIVNCTTNNYSISANVTGLTGSGLVLRNNGGDDLAISANGSMTFATAVASGASYSVTIFSQPTIPAQTCSATSGTGTVGGGNVSTISINCTTNLYSLTVSVSGLTGAGLVLQNNGGDNLTISANGNATFATPLSQGESYSISVNVQPVSPWQTCTVASGAGTMPASDVSGINISCITNTYSVSPSISGLAGSGLVLQNNGGDDLSVSANGSTTFSTSITSGISYNVSILTQPTSPAQTCTVSSGSGTIAGASATGPLINCATNLYSVSVTVSGLLGSGLVLKNNAGDDLSIAADGSATFASTLSEGSAYAVTVETQPNSPSQTCAVTGGAGSMPATNVTGISIACTTNTYSLSVDVSGMITGGMAVTESNSTQNLTGISSNGSHTFSTSLASGAAYNVSVNTQPLGHICSVTSGSGIVASSAVTISISCTGDGTLPYVTSFFPINAASSVAMDTKITVSFSEPMNATTITANSSSTACSGTIQLSADNFSSCVQWSGQPSASAGQAAFTLVPAAPLLASTNYKIRVTQSAQDPSGVALASAVTQPTGFTTGTANDTTAPTVLSTYFVDAATTNTFVSATLTVRFSELMDPATMSATSDGNCTGSLQVSSDNFATCVPMNPVYPLIPETRYYLKPLSDLAVATNYKFRVTTTVKDMTGNALATQYQHATGFTTIAGTVPALTVASISPGDGVTGVPYTLGPANYSISFVGGGPVLIGTVTVNIGTTACVGTIQISADNFQTCVPHAKEPTWSGQTSILINPQYPLAGSSTYKTRITTGVKNVAGVPLAADYVTPTGFTTVP